MTTILLNNNFFIDIDPLNYTLKEKFRGKTKDGKVKESVRVHGYYNKLSGAIKKYVETYVQAEIDGESLTMEKYVERVEKAVLMAVRSVEEILERAGESND